MVVSGPGMTTRSLERWGRLTLFTAPARRGPGVSTWGAPHPIVSL